MKKVKFSLIFIFVVCASLLIFLAAKNKLFRPATKVTLPEIQEQETKINETASPAIVKKTSPDLDEVKKLLSEFPIEPAVKTEIIANLQDAALDQAWEKEAVSKAELKKSGLDLVQIAQSSLNRKITNIVSGYQVPDAEFAAALTACLPSGNRETAQEKELKSEALANIGLAALSEARYGQAKKAFQMIAEHYPDTQVAAIVQPELARILAQDNE